MDVAAQLFQRFFLGLVGQVCQHFHRKSLLRVQLFSCICQRPQLFGSGKAACTGGDHGTKATGDKGQHIACDLQHRRGHGSAGGKGIGHALRGRGHRVTDHGLRNKAGQKGLRCHNAANAAQTEDHRKGNAHSQQRAACAISFFALIRMFSTGVGSGFAKICRNQSGIPVGSAAPSLEGCFASP